MAAALFGVLTLGVIEVAATQGNERISCPLSASGEGGECPLLPSLRFELVGEVAPMRLSRNELQPVALTLQGRVKTTDGTHPSALREMIIDLDHDVSIDSMGVPVCRVGPDSIRSSPGEVSRLCRSSILGGGKADFEIALPEEKPVMEVSPVTIFNGGLSGDVRTLYISTQVKVPAPAPIVLTAKIERHRHENYGSQIVVRAPVIASGSGSLLGFDLRVKRLFGFGGVRRSVVRARCPDGRLDVGVPRAFFRNEAHTPGTAASTVMRGSLSIPCTPRG